MEKNQSKLSTWYLLLVLWGLFISYNLLIEATKIEQIPYSQFQNYLNEGKVIEIAITQNKIFGKIKKAQNAKPTEFATYRVDPELVQQLDKYNIKFQGAIENTFWKDLFSWVAPALIFFGVWTLFIGRIAAKEGMSGGLMSIGRSKARVYVEKDIKVSFADVAGIDEAKEELKEVVSFLKEPARCIRLGGRLPKGILLVGPPGTGKTLLARAVAGEAHVPFFSISGSEFVEMFVGVGAARVRDLFEQAKKKAPCIIFIDELDALGRARGLNPLGGHDEKEQTLNQLLTELDGFDPTNGVVLLAATNRPEILDPALLRAGRFDRHVLVDRPDKKGRVQILEVHLKKIVLDENVDPEKIAALTPGFTGADLANLANEAALLATRRAGNSVALEDFTAAIERIVAGLEKKNRLLNEKERKIVAYHEMGHTLVSLAIPNSDPIQKVSIIPRGIGALGYTLQRPIEDRFLMSQQELENKLTILLGGRAAESIVFGEISTGATDDLYKATNIAQNMVTRYGMSEHIGPVNYEIEPTTFLPNITQTEFNKKRFSEETATIVDHEVKYLISTAFERAVKILKTHRNTLDNTAQELLLKETLLQDELPILIEDTSHRLCPKR